MTVRRALAGAAATLATLAAAAAVPSAWSSASATATEVTLVVAPPDTQWRRFVTIRGEVAARRAGQKVTVQFDECGMTPRTFRDVAETTTHEDGTWSVEWLYGRGSGAYRAVVGDAVSAPVPVRGRPDVLIRPEYDGDLEVWVTATVPFSKRHVLLQRRTPRVGKWVTVKRVELSRQLPNSAMFGLPSISTGTGELRLRLPQRTPVRAVFPDAAARPCYLGAQSKVVRTR